MKIYAETYGCTMNRGDTEIMLGRLLKCGHEITENSEESEIALINTCAVKRTTLNRVIYRLRELYETEDQKIIVTGCLPLIDLEKIEEIGTFDGIISCLTTDHIEGIVEKVSHGQKGLVKIRNGGEKLTGERYRTGKISAPTPIAEGCLSNCSFCCVKFARGKLKSFEPEKILEEIKNELKAGRREIYVTTQDTAAYGMDIGTNLPELLKKIANLSQKFKVRVGMMNPKGAKKILYKLLEAYEDDKIYKFLHLPVQSGSDEVLRSMNRGYKVKEFKKIVDKFRRKFPDLYLATDVIVGFPGESKEDFRDSCNLVKEVKPDKVNLTRFTPMPGTKAKEMKQIKSEEKKRRSEEMSRIQKDLGYKKNLDYVGTRSKGLVTKKGKKGGYVARIHNYKPTIVKEAKPGEFIKIQIKEARPTYLKGEVMRD